MKEKMSAFVERGEIREFIVTCMSSGLSSIAFSKHWRDAISLKDFKSEVFSDESLKLTQAYAELSKDDENHWYHIRSMFGDNCFKTFSDAGGILIGNADWKIHLSNGYGDDETRVCIFDEKNKKDFNEHMLNYKMDVRGKFNIYAYDCANKTEEYVTKTLNGKYSIYSGSGFVAFVK